MKLFTDMVAVVLLAGLFFIIGLITGVETMGSSIERHHFKPHADGLCYPSDLKEKNIHD